MSPLLQNLLSRCETDEASDIHITVGESPRFRMRGLLMAQGAFPPLDAREVDDLAVELGLTTFPADVPDGAARVRQTLLKEGAIDGALTSPTGARYRFNVFREQSRPAVAIRQLDSKFRSFSELGLPLRLESFCDERDGLVIVTGPTGSGKSTTLATMLNRINRTRPGHIITIEDPIEYVHASDRCLVHQRQVGRDARGFGEALVEALRQDPDIILVGEMRDVDTARTALRAAETGHLVFTTLHSGDCAGAVERLVSIFPADEQPSARRQLSLVLRGICAQHLLLSADHTRRVAACELLVNTTGCANLIATGRSAQIYSVIETGGGQGMQSLEQSLVELLSSGLIDERTALSLSRSPDLFKGRQGMQGTFALGQPSFSSGSKRTLPG